LQEELSLLSKLFRNGVSSFAEISTTPELAAPIAKDKRSLNETNQSFPNVSPATEFSSAESNGIEIDAREIIKSQNSGVFVLSVKDNSTSATKFSNVQYDEATKNSSSTDHINIAKYSLNPSINNQMNHENLNKSTKNDLISIWAGSDAAPICL
jgi:hypothetical protein